MSKRNVNWVALLAVVVTCFIVGLSACATGGGSNNSPVPGPIGSQTPVYINGRVLNASNSSPIPNATVSSYGADAGSYQTTADSTGTYQLYNGVVPYASYPIQVTAAAPGYTSSSQSSTSSNTATINFSLTPLATGTPTSTATQ